MAGLFDLTGKVALVTGSTRGIGKSIAEELARAGAKVSISSRKAEACEQTLTEFRKQGFDAIAQPCNVSRKEELQALVDATQKKWGHIDIVCANAGIISQPVATWEIDLDQWRELIDVTLTGVFVTIKAAIPHMIAAGNGGSITLTSSGAALISGGGFADYKAAKSGILSLTRTLACELAEHFIRVNAICPTAVDTPMIQNETLYRSFRPDLPNPGREDVKAGFQTMNLLPIPWVDAADVSNAIVWLASDAARYITGVTLPVDAGNQHK